MGIVSLTEFRTFANRALQLEKAAGQKHHYVPKFYLKQWAGEDGRLCEFSRPYDIVKPRRTHPDGTGYVRGLYAFDTLPPPVANALEGRFLLRADDQAYAALCELLDCNVNLDQASRSAWSRFLMSLFHRTPEGVARIIKKIADEYPTYLEAAIADVPAAIQEQDADVIHQLRVNFSDSDLERMALHSLHKIMDSVFLGTTLNSMVIGVIAFDDTHHPLLTSDRPMVMTNGLNKPDSHIVMPISPRHLFVATNERQTMNQLTAMAESAGLAQRMNNRMARQARKYVYAIDDEPLDFVAARLGEKAPWCPFE